MSSCAQDKLVYMANQIATAFRAQEGPNAIHATYAHLLRFWDPRMRAMICEHHRNGGEGLTEIAREAVAVLAADAAPDPAALPLAASKNHAAPGPSNRLASILIACCPTARRRLPG